MADARVALNGNQSGVPNASRDARSAIAKFAAGTLLVALCAGGLSFAVAPECDARQRYTTEGCPCQYSWFSSQGDCGKYCCNPNNDPQGEWCKVDRSLACNMDIGYCEEPSAADKVSNASRAVRHAMEFFLSPYFLILFGIILVMNYGRLCCAPSSAEKWALILMTTFALACNLLMYFGDWVVYLATDCHDEWRGLSDFLLVVVFICNFVLTIVILTMVTLSQRVAANEDLVQSIAEHRSRRDPNVLVLEISEARMRSFLDAEEAREAQVTVTQTGAAATCLQCYMWFFMGLLLAGIVVVVATLYESRSACFWAAFALLFLSLLCFAKHVQSRRRACGCREQCKKRQFERARAKVNGPSELVLFHNPAYANAPPVATTAHMSGAFLGANQLQIAPNRALLPGQMKTTTSVAVLGVEMEGGPGLEFTVKVELQNAGVMPVQTTAEAARRMPLEAGQVSQAQAWIEQHSEVFVTASPMVELA